MIIDFLILSKLIGAGLVANLLMAVGIRIGVIFVGGSLNLLVRNIKAQKKLLTYTLWKHCLNLRVQIKKCKNLKILFVKNSIVLKYIESCQ